MEQKQIALDLTKKFELNLEKAQIFNIPTMTTKLAVDRSGSMFEEFRDGWVDHTIDLFIAAAMKFDDNGSLDMGFFNHNFQKAPSANVNDIGIYTKKHRISADGGTSYVPILENMIEIEQEGLLDKIKGLFGSKKQPKRPVYLGMITDGDSTDQIEFEQLLNKLENSGTFIQIIGLGNQLNRNYLNRLQGQFKNVSFVHLVNPKSVSDDMFYELISNEQFKNWLQTV